MHLGTETNALLIFYEWNASSLAFGFCTNLFRYLLLLINVYTTIKKQEAPQFNAKLILHQPGLFFESNGETPLLQPKAVSSN